MPGWLKRKLEILKAKYSLYFVIKKYEELFRDVGFNRYFLDYEKVLMMIERMGVQSAKDRKFKDPFLWCGDGKKVLFYNPEVHPEELVIKLGHELGHLICEHYREDFMWIKSAHRVFSNRMEKDADVIGYLCWIPTPYLDRVRGYSWDIDEVVKDLSNCDTEYGIIYKNLPVRFQIYQEYLKADEEVSRVQNMIKEFNRNVAHGGER